MSSNDVSAAALSNALREVTSFAVAVLELHGEVESKIATEDWLDVMDGMTAKPDASVRYWRSITILAAHRLALRTCNSGGLEPSAAYSPDLTQSVA